MKLVTINEACGLARVSRRTLYNWLAAGQVRAVRVASGRQRIVVASLWPSTRCADCGARHDEPHFNDCINRLETTNDHHA